MKLSDIEHSIRQAFTARNGMGPTCVTVADANAQEIKISFNMPSREGVKTKVYSLDKSSFSQMIGARVSKISFDNVLNAYLESKTQPNDVATLRNQAADNGEHPQTSLAAEEQSDAPESVKPHQEKTKEVSQHSR